VLISAHDRPGVVGLAVMPGQGDPGRGQDVHRGGCWRPDCLTIASWCPAVLFDDPFAAAAVEGQDFAVPCCM
jgi:hypothetical protein